MNKRFRSPLLPLAAVLWACGDATGPITELPRELIVAERKLIEADNRFAFKLFREIAAQDTTGGNIFVSPLSVAMALGMTYNGAAGNTRSEMQDALELGDMTIDEVNQGYRDLIDLLHHLDPSVEFTLANSIWHRDSFQPLATFLDISRTYFDAAVQALDFSAPSAAPTINAWVSEQTQDRITEIVDAPIDPLMMMFLINAIYFKGDWTYRFDPDRTRPEPFRISADSTVPVEMMRSEEDMPVRGTGDGNVVVVELAYGGGAYAMTIVIPFFHVAIDSLAAALTQEQWNSWIAALDSTRLRVSLPKFTLEYELTMNDVLKALGMVDAFDDGGRADFSKIHPDVYLYVSEVKHKTFVDVNEEGTEAAAVTSVGVRTVSCNCIEVNRPFLFAIRERFSGTILFMGRIMDPSGEA